MTTPGCLGSACNSTEEKLKANLHHLCSMLERSGFNLHFICRALAYNIVEMPRTLSLHPHPTCFFSAMIARMAMGPGPLQRKLVPNRAPLERLGWSLRTKESDRQSDEWAQCLTKRSPDACFPSHQSKILLTAHSANAHGPDSKPPALRTGLTHFQTRREATGAAALYHLWKTLVHLFNIPSPL